MNKENSLFWGINTPESTDPEEMDVLERKHVPVITAPDTVKKGEPFEVKVEVGKYHDHPNQHQHFIQWIELLLDENRLGKVSLQSEKGEPTIMFTAQLQHSGNLIALEHCNLHGTWKSFEKEIRVEE